MATSSRKATKMAKLRARNEKAVDLSDEIRKLAGTATKDQLRRLAVRSTDIESTIEHRHSPRKLAEDAIFARAAQLETSREDLATGRLVPDCELADELQRIMATTNADTAQ